ncbi:MAG: hypothetical protein AB1443_03725 [Pseudomonadota bacterium]
MKRMKRMLSTVLRSLSTLIPLESGDMLSPRRKAQLLQGKGHERLDKHHARKLDLAKAAQHHRHHPHQHPQH